ncbi:hypothetical protein KFL_000350290 [Klebsormidium nitens]|uniref:Uncharacterized protein n=1 Tax=Klebsormidium nitens TaxID=105231 RepID=A0A1Y1HM12_KLENI|nr:hypothetical protein KFL_000350290 [Klebsormidium nitens]|eukprot:GAQ79675.1 hypothetical protein KFL_000350290 [Klebsormidium nitens]
MVCTVGISLLRVSKDDTYLKFLARFQLLPTRHQTRTPPSNLPSSVCLLKNSKMARSLLALTALLALASCIATSEAQTITAPTVVGWLKNITTQSPQQLQSSANQITLLSGPLIIIGQGPFPPIIRGFTSIVTTGTSANAIHQQLLNILIGKSGLFQTAPFIGQPISQVLRSIESIVDALAFNLIDACQARAADLTSEKDKLKVTIQLVITKYDGISVAGVQPGGRKLLSVAA